MDNLHVIRNSFEDFGSEKCTHFPTINIIRDVNFSISVKKRLEILREIIFEN